jgi:Tfp pilus assembly protein FimT
MLGPWVLPAAQLSLARTGASWVRLTPTSFKPDGAVKHGCSASIAVSGCRAVMHAIRNDGSRTEEARGLSNLHFQKTSSSCRPSSQ